MKTSTLFLRFFFFLGLLGASRNNIFAQCPAGQYWNGSTCINCAFGTYQDEAGKTSCKPCAVGTATGYVEGSTFCPPCAAGTAVGFQGAAVCNSCAQGTYQPNMGQTVCIDCPVGQYQSATGQISCQNCPNGTSTSGTAATNANQCTVVLPLEMFSFRSSMEQEVVQLQWTTASEKNLSFYTVQKSNNGDNWTTIARMNGQGNKSGATIYAASDPFPSVGVTYYRVKAFDFDGTNHYSKILTVEFSKKLNPLKVYPNPLSHFLNVAHRAEKIKSAAIFNMIGQAQMTVKFEGTHIGTIDASGLAAGQYILRVYTEGGIFSEKIVKQ